MSDKQLYAEVYAFVMVMGEKYIDELPAGFWNTICTLKGDEYIPTLNPNKLLNEQGLSTEAISMIAGLKLNYWCKTDEERQSLMAVLQANEDEIRKELEGVASTRGLLKFLNKN